MVREFDPEQQRMRSYLLAQSERATWLDLWPRVTQARLQLVDSLRGVSNEQARFRVAQGEWTILEVASHLLEYSRSVSEVIAALAGGSIPAQVPVLSVLTDPGDARIEAVRAELIRDAISLGTLVDGLPDDVSLAGTVDHDFFGGLHCKAWYLFQRVHDLDHAGQIAQIQAAPEYPA